MQDIFAIYNIFPHWHVLIQSPKFKTKQILTEKSKEHFKNSSFYWFFLNDFFVGFLEILLSLASDCTSFPWVSDLPLVLFSFWLCFLELKFGYLWVSCVSSSLFLHLFSPFLYLCQFSEPSPSCLVNSSAGYRILGIKSFSIRTLKTILNSLYNSMLLMRSLMLSLF